MAYNIMIDETQRAFLVTALKEASNLATLTLSEEEGTSKCVAYDTEREEYMGLLKMLEELPDVEKDHPGITHGLCL